MARSGPGRRRCACTPGAARAPSSALPNPARLAFLPANAPNTPNIEWFHNAILLPITIAISLLVLALLGYVVYRFNERAIRRLENDA